MANSRCSDRMCGAPDCQTCYPGNKEGEICASCDEEYESCECEEFTSAEEDDYDDRDDRDETERPGYYDDVANNYESKMGY